MMAILLWWRPITLHAWATDQPHTNPGVFHFDTGLGGGLQALRQPGEHLLHPEALLRRTMELSCAAVASAAASGVGTVLPWDAAAQLQRLVRQPCPLSGGPASSVAPRGILPSGPFAARPNRGGG